MNILVTVILFIMLSCIRTEANTAPKVDQSESDSMPQEELLYTQRNIQTVLEHAKIPQNIQHVILNDSDFAPTLQCILNGDSSLRQLIDKQHPFAPIDYEPDDLVSLSVQKDYQINRHLLLRKEAEEALQTMAHAARNAGITLVVSSAYRSYQYQIEVYNRNVRLLGKEQADRESAQPGYSQHQTGLVVDFGSITQAFAETYAGKWLQLHANTFGWSLSFPDGYETVTGYMWESWHYRYVGVEMCGFINRYFEGIQQYGLSFLYAWEKHLTKF
ncbi:MAG: M15 family metallopeptidase [Treponema sp.]|jgi:D-alanyl-D-alanine carboxypeptidase|nr:M15 family metallopeptidase [Treponema sp.]